jgi:hypothetical protein
MSINDPCHKSNELPQTSINAPTTRSNDLPKTFVKRLRPLTSQRRSPISQETIYKIERIEHYTKKHYFCEIISWRGRFREVSMSGSTLQAI